MNNNNYALKVTKLSKKYRLGIRNFNDAFKRLKGISPSYHWALREATFKVPQGKIVGVIGPNGAGKSTLLKILSKITVQTSGTFKNIGKVASLLEAGVGFHPEYTGIENVILQGAYLGMDSSQVKTRLPEIIEFSGIGKYANTPVKRYSSGMSLRLATAAALFLDADILLLDEILSVADVTFRQKYSKNLDNLSKSENKTILFVSHNHDLLSQNCDSGILVWEGVASYFDNFEECLNSYKEKLNFKSVSANQYPIIFKALNFHYEINKIHTQKLAAFEPFQINIEYSVIIGSSNLSFGLAIENNSGSEAISLDPQTQLKFLSKESGKFVLSLHYPFLPCNPGEYILKISMWNGSKIETISSTPIPVQIDGDPILGPGQKVGFRIPTIKYDTSSQIAD